MLAANEMLLMGEKIDASKAVSNHLCTRIMEDCNHCCESAFSIDSIGSKAVEEIDNKLLSLPSGDKTAKIFVEMIRGKRRYHLAAVCKEELLRLDQRIESGEVLEAVLELSIARNKL